MHTNSFDVIVHYMQQDTYELFINSDTLSNLFYILSNHSILSETEVLEKMKYVTEIFSLISIEQEDVERALSLCADSKSKHEDYEDAMQYICAKKIGAELIISNDKNFVSVDIALCRTSN